MHLLRLILESLGYIAVVVALAGLIALGLRIKGWL